jgi:hypothetical protein
MTVFERLSRINVNEHVEKKKDLTYLSWAWAWSVTKKECPDATYKILPTEYDEVLGFMCHTTVTIENETLEMWLPVMDGANKSMLKTPYTYKGVSWENGRKVQVEKTVDAATTFDINKTLMRCLVKNLAMFGLGIYIYAGEDLPDSDSKETVKSSEPVKAPDVLIDLEKGTDNWNKAVNFVQSNKAQGIDALVKRLGVKYKISSELKKELATICNQ